MRQTSLLKSHIVLSPPEAAGGAGASDRTTIGHIDIAPGLTLRHLVGKSPAAKGTVLFLHGFPETMLVWKAIANELVADYNVHAFDWPGYGLSSRPAAEDFEYSPKGYADILRAYVEAAGIDRSVLTIYATDIGSLPALLAALEEPEIAKQIFVGDFAPLNRPQYMSENLQNLKSEPSASHARAYFKNAGTQIPANAHRAGLDATEQYDLLPDVLADMTAAWEEGGMTSGDAFYHYYSKFTRDEDYFEANINGLKTPFKILWGEKDVYINKGMGEELARLTGAPLAILPGLGHYVHLQKPDVVVEEIRASA